MADLFEQHCNTILVLGVGTLGAEVASAGAVEDDGSDGARLACWAAAHTDPARLIASGLERKLLLDAGPVGTGPFAEKNLLRDLGGKQEDIQTLTAGRNAVILTGSLHEQTAALLLPALANELAQRGLFVAVVALESQCDETRRLPIHADVRFPVIDEGAGGEISVGAGRRRVQKKLLDTILDVARITAEAPDSEVASEALLKNFSDRTAAAAANREVESLNF